MRITTAVMLMTVGGLLAVACSRTAPPASHQSTTPTTPLKSLFDYQEVMIPMRDGVRLQTVVMRTHGIEAPLPILLVRTPYGVPDKAPEKMPLADKELAADGYIFVYQNLRGRFKSEGTFTLSEDARLEHGKGTIETRDAMGHNRLAC